MKTVKKNAKAEKTLAQSENKPSRKVPVWELVLFGVLAVAVIVGATLGVSSLVKNQKQRKAVSYDTVTIIIETPKRVLRRYAGYDGEFGDGEQLLRIDDQQDNPDYAEFPGVATGRDIVLNAAIDMGPGTKRGWLTDPKNVPLASIVVKETGEKLVLSENDIVLRKTGGSKVATRIFRFAVTAEGKPISVAMPEATATQNIAQGGASTMSNPPAKK